mmetsp:Transcript_4661/g.10970  ORF Transcript_4661/g.10970 Transcript_4661/m.10970 type:complete len:95 (-) Transcript_4661:211-495(-)
MFWRKYSRNLYLLFMKKTTFVSLGLELGGIYYGFRHLVSFLTWVELRRLFKANSGVHPRHNQTHCNTQVNDVQLQMYKHNLRDDDSPQWGGDRW